MDDGDLHEENAGHKKVALSMNGKGFKLIIDNIWKKQAQKHAHSRRKKGNGDQRRLSGAMEPIVES